MITEAIVSGGLLLLRGLFDLFPDDSLDYPAVDGFGAMLGDLVGPFDALVPLHELADTLAITVTVLLPGMLVYRGIMFVWGKVPVFGS